MEDRTTDIYQVPQNLKDARELKQALETKDLSKKEKGTIQCRLGLFYFFNTEHKNTKSAKTFFRQSQDNNDLLGTAYYFLHYDLLNNKETHDNLTDYLSQNNQSVQAFLTFSQTNNYACYLLGQIYRRGLFEPKKTIDNQKAIQCFEISKENPLLEIMSRYYLVSLYKDNYINRARIIQYLEFIFKRVKNKKAFCILRKWAHLFRKLETNIFSINEKFSEISKNLTQNQKKLKAPLEDIGKKSLTPDNIKKLKEKIQNFLALIDNPKHSSSQSLADCRQYLTDSFQSPNDSEKYLKSRMIFFNIYL